MPIDRRDFVRITAAGLLSVTAGRTAAAERLPNIVLIYADDYDGTFPYARFHAHGIPTSHSSAEKGKYTYVWKNAISPYLKSIDLFACPSNPRSRSVPGKPCVWHQRIHTVFHWRK